MITLCFFIPANDIRECNYSDQNDFIAFQFAPVAKDCLPIALWMLNYSCKSSNETFLLNLVSDAGLEKSKYQHYWT